MTEPVAKRADQLVVGDLVPDEHLPYRFNKGPAEVVFVAVEPGDASGFRGEAHTFFAFRYPNGQHESTTVRAEAGLMVWPAPDPTGLLYSRADDAETTQPIGRIEPHFEPGRVVVEVAGGFVEIDPPEGFVPASGRIEQPGLIVGDTAAEQRDNAYAAYDRDEAEGFVPASADEEPAWLPGTGFFEPNRVPDLVGEDARTVAEQREAYEREEAMRLPRCPNCRGRHHTTEPCS